MRLIGSFTACEIMRNGEKLEFRFPKWLRAGYKNKLRIENRS